MLRFLAGHMLVYAGLLGWALFEQPEFLQASRGTYWLVGLMLAVPTAVAWATLEVVQRAAPRRVFDSRLRKGIMLTSAGLVAGVFGAVLAAPMLVLIKAVGDVAVLSLCVACACTVVLLVLPRLKPGRCVHCEYELASEQRICPECGAGFSKI